MPGGTRSYEMARRLVQFGHEVHIITTWRGDCRKGSSWFDSQESGITVHWLPVPYSNRMGFLARLKAFFMFALMARSKSVEIGGDIVLATSTPLTIAIPGVYASRSLKVPLVFEVRDLWPSVPIALGALKNPISKKLAKNLEIWAYRNSDAIIALSPGMKEGIVSKGFSASRIAVIPNGSDNQDFSYDKVASDSFRQSREWLRDRPLLVYAGTFGTVNGVGYLVELAARVLNIAPSIRFLLVGDGKERESVIALAEKLGVLGKNVFFEPQISKREVPALLAAATFSSSVVIDLPELRDNSANKVFDGFAAGKPVFINHGGWLHDLILKHQCGLSVWGMSLEAAAIEFAEKIQDKHWSECAGNLARELAEKYFDRDTLAIQLANVLEAVAIRSATKIDQISPGDY